MNWPPFVPITLVDFRRRCADTDYGRVLHRAPRPWGSRREGPRRNRDRTDDGQLAQSGPRRDVREPVIISRNLRCRAQFCECRRMLAGSWTRRPGPPHPVDERSARSTGSSRAGSSRARTAHPPTRREERDRQQRMARKLTSRVRPQRCGPAFTEIEFGHIPRPIRHPLRSVQVTFASARRARRRSWWPRPRPPGTRAVRRAGDRARRGRLVHRLQPA